jgi:hypothetical protein
VPTRATEETGRTIYRADFRVAMLLVADESVRPAVDDFDFQLVVAGLDGIGDFHPPWSTPDDTEVFAIQFHPPHVVDNAQIEIGFSYWSLGEFE